MAVYHVHECMHSLYVRRYVGLYVCRYMYVYMHMNLYVYMCLYEYTRLYHHYGSSGNKVGVMNCSNFLKSLKRRLETLSKSLFVLINSSVVPGACKLGGPRVALDLRKIFQHHQKTGSLKGSLGFGVTVQGSLLREICLEHPSASAARSRTPP